MKTTKVTENVKTDNKLVKLLKLYLAVSCAISAYFLSMVVKSDMQVVLYVVSIGPALVASYLVYDGWVK
jgi:hypothetical protein